MYFRAIVSKEFFARIRYDLLINDCVISSVLIINVLLEIIKFRKKLEKKTNLYIFNDRNVLTYERYLNML